MDEPVLIAKVERDDAGTFRVLAPKVGVWSDHPHAGALLGPGSRAGTIRHLNRRFVVILPEGTAGQVSAGLPHDREVAVEYGQSLFELSPVLREAVLAVGEDAAIVGHPAGAGLAEGTRAVVSPTDGVFYRGPSPGAPPFAEAGKEIRSGDPVGLVEVMKTFNQILYGGPGFPERATVVEVRCGDAEEVRAGQVLVVVR
jgi:acetyl-CoA carboxylase biotin carboxyl carrier protein